MAIWRMQSISSSEANEPTTGVTAFELSMDEDLSLKSVTENRTHRLNSLEDS